jgi:cobalt/nickel transport system permease protein
MAPIHHRFSAPAVSAVGGRAAFLDAVDPRARIVVSVAFSLVIAVTTGLPALAIAFLTAAAVSVASRVRPLALLKRLVPVTLFAIVLALLLPWSAGTSPLFAIGTMQYTEEGLRMAVAIGLKANAIVLWVMVLLGTSSVITLGHALGHLGVPEKLIHLLLFVFRYVDVLDGEYLRLRTAMKMRGFRPRINAHTYRSYGYLVGMLLVRSLDRSERVVAAMKCRGFRGQFHLLDHFAFARRDVWFLAAASVIVLLLLIVEYS